MSSGQLCEQSQGLYQGLYQEPVEEKIDFEKERINISTLDLLLEESKEIDEFEDAIDFLYTNALERRDSPLNETFKNDTISKNAKNIMNSRFDNLILLLKQNGYSYSNLVCEWINSAKRELYSNNWNAVSKYLGFIINKIRPFNIKEMLNEYKLTEEAAKTVVNESIILLLGHTGSGKSTTIHFLAG